MRSTFTKHLLFLGMVLLTACGQIPSPSPTPLNNSTQVQDTSNLIPSTSEQTITTPFADAHKENVEKTKLSSTQIERITFASNAYLTQNKEQTQRIASLFQQEKPYGNINNLREALAIAILRDARMISSETDVSDFYGMDAENINSAIEKTFAENQFSKYHFDQSPGDFDFSAFPLQVGDLVVLYDGIDNTINTMLLITQIDAQGCVYSVTNINSTEGIIIKEVILYDPMTKGTEESHHWTDLSLPNTGNTGLGGFDVWRINIEIMDAGIDEQNLADQMLAEQIEQTLSVFGGKWNILIRDGEGRNVYSHLSSEQNHVGSIIKVPIAMLFFKYLEWKGISPENYESYLLSKKDGKSYYELLYSMLVHSEEAATSSLGELLDKSGMGVYTVLNSWEVYHTYIFKRFSTSEDIALILEGLYKGNFIAPEGRNVILKLMETYTPEDDTRLGVIRPLLPEGAHFYNKQGTVTGERLVVGDSAIISYPGLNKENVYYLVITGYPGEKDTLFTTLEHCIERIARLFWNYAVHCETIAKN